MASNLEKKKRDMERTSREIGHLIGRAVGEASGNSWGFMLVLFDFAGGDDAALSYISNGQRSDMIRMLTELLDNLRRGDMGTADGKPQKAGPLGEA